MIILCDKCWAINYDNYLTNIKKEWVFLKSDLLIFSICE